MPGTLIGAILCRGPEFGRRNGYLARITTEGIEVYDERGRIQEFYTNPKIQSYVIVDVEYIYCMCDNTTDTMIKYDFKRQ